ncbi:phosphatase PAP2 family protein [Nocardioides marmotae]|uniref:PAP2 family protein n=1 Tax=Nocardioides marmotae TaxID=2663857 RepID=A0A6I3J8A2_9ACTN|nr:phosphatase PAP2 family protein [Nocardioides marmotae]MCR6031002.1 PAP2 family protein [Gordonia jinghuaiqii]MBC9731715.1 phosphatase PAP2 family protein [Nocardioides marmotae]MTB82837.1 PAP2 family protein [Nocardioides marmotae]MTB94639.1 PAP2 family protein [Nocardioides marmotae]QKE01353.1 phosphatase PAP2 family protein [Nocardioides marmotae]
MRLSPPATTAVRSQLPWVLGQAVVVTLAVLVYFGVRGLTEGRVDRAQENARLVVSFERWLGIDLEEVAQAPLESYGRVETVANWIYIWGHWPVIIVTMVWLAWQHRDNFLWLRDSMMISGAIGMVVFALFPVAPPRLAGLGLVDTVSQSSEAYRVLQPPAFVNQYAAMPSLHAGWDLLVAMAIVAATSSLPLRLLASALPVLMVLAVVVTANHYLLDVVAGIAIALAATVPARALARRRRLRAAR